jgi:MoaA/NifB/PqqE/SkfB family radical SAM enzyme
MAFAVSTPRYEIMSLRQVRRLVSFFGALMVKRWLLPEIDVQPVVAELFLTDNCNLRCVSCACWRSETPDELSRQEWFDVIRQLGNLGFVKLNFTGGEVLIRPDAADIIAYASTHTEARLHLNTNGILLRPSLARTLIDAGVRSFNVSFDGPTPEIHDGIRGERGAFEKTLEHFRELVKLRDKYHLRLRIMFTVMRKNIDQLVDMAKLAQELEVQLFFNVVTDHTFLFRGYNIVTLGNIEDKRLDEGLNRLLAHQRRQPQYLPRYSVVCYIGDHFRDQLQKKLPCTEANLKLMIHSQGQVGGCWAHDPEFSVREQSIASMLKSTKFRKTQTDLFFKRCKGCGSNHSLNMRLEPRPMVYDLLWRAGIFKTRRKLFASP